MSDKWDARFLEMAELVASWSKDPSTKVGAVIVRPDKTIASVGYNGFPRGMSDHHTLYDNREEKYSRVVHSELNAILNAKEPLNGYTCYITLAPCDRCAVTLIQAGIKRVVCIAPSPEQAERWGAAIDKSCNYFDDCGVEFEFVGVLNVG